MIQANYTTRREKDKYLTYIERGICKLQLKV